MPPAAPAASRILIVDDSPEILRLLRAAFDGARYEVVAASSGDEAIRLCSAGEFDAVLTDVEMPGMSGCELAAWVAVERPRTKVVLMSGYELPCSGCPYTPRCVLIRKPFQLAGVVEAVARALGR